VADLKGERRRTTGLSKATSEGATYPFGGEGGLARLEGKQMSRISAGIGHFVVKRRRFMAGRSGEVCVKNALMRRLNTRDGGTLNRKGRAYLRVHHPQSSEIKVVTNRV